MLHQNLILGYHGCSKSTAEDIFSGRTRHLTISKKKYDWLGSGLYFWENDYNRALQWAKDHHPKSYEVIGAFIRPGNCLDLSDTLCLELLASAYDGFIFSLEKEGVPRNQFPMNKDGRRDLDCAIINHLHFLQSSLNNKGFDTVRSPFIEGNPLYEGSAFRQQNHIQWSVLNPASSIVGYFRCYN